MTCLYPTSGPCERTRFGGFFLAHEKGPLCSGPFCVMTAYFCSNIT